MKSKGKQFDRSLPAVVLLLCFSCLTILLAVTETPEVQPETTLETNNHFALKPPQAGQVFVDKYFAQQDHTGYFSKSATCRLPSACIQRKGESIEIVLNSTSLSPNALKGCSSSGLTITTNARKDNKTVLNQSSWDLILGFYPTHYSYQFPHFVLLGGKLMDMAETLLGDRRRKNAQQFLYQKTSLSGGQQMDGPVPGEPSLEERSHAIAPAVMVHDWSLKPDSKKMLWIPEFLSNLFRKSSSGVQMIRSPNEHEMLCFRSVWIPDAKLNSIRQVRSASHTLYAENNLLKEPKANMCSSPLRVTFLNRAGSRSVVNTSTILEGVRDGLQGSFSEIEIREEFFENATYDEQVAVMQQTDVLIAAHGAGIANALFMRQKSFLLEVIPFGYVFTGFQSGLRDVFEIEGSYVVSEPDFENFDKELTRLCPAGEDCSFLASQFRKLSTTADVSIVSQKLSNYQKFPEFVSINSRSYGARALAAQKIRGRIPDLRERLKDWATRRCPSTPVVSQH